MAWWTSTTGKPPVREQLPEWPCLILKTRLPP